MSLRSSGILLHVTSLPSAFGVGDLGPEAYRFAEFLAEAGQGIWQVLPLNPACPACGNSPYLSLSAFAGNPLMVSPELLRDDGLLTQGDLDACPRFDERRVEFGPVEAFKVGLLRKAADAFFVAGGTLDCGYLDFCRDNAHWLDDYVLFLGIRGRLGGAAWTEWPEGLRRRDPEELSAASRELERELFTEKFFQYAFFKQWKALKEACNERSIQIFGDLPIYVSHDSADVWANPGFFKLDEAGRPLAVAGVPPDYFSETGQYWGNPVYDWKKLADTRYEWWIRRIEHNLKLVDLLRFDHFRGFVAYWEIPAEEKTAVNGKWVEVPVRDFFDTLARRFPNLPIIAEDLGIITPDVRETMERYGFPGMKVLQFAFGGDLAGNPYVPHNHTVSSVVYTGTHDNNTARGWFRRDATVDDRERLCRYLGHHVTESNAHEVMIRMAMMSVADRAVVPMQDVLGLDESARMNLPSVPSGNWGWRMRPGEITPGVARGLREMAYMYGRDGQAV